MPTYLNPVYPHGCPDPFALKFCGLYYAYSTGHAPDGRAFPVFTSPDLVHWRALGGALQPPALDWPEYWAPEVSYHNGRFYMYYSLGNEAHMHLRVAVATHPAGPFADSGRQLTSEPFAIDAHVFADDDGQRYLFYATDFLSHTHIGTGTAVDRLLDPFTLAGEPRPVTRARYPWQVYDPQRASKGGVRWHTVEGPFVEKHKGRYYQMFSGGNWQNPSYGVSYALTDSLTQTAEWAQSADGEAILPILRTIPGRVIGPGHNSAVRGPDNRQLYCVYHRWTDDLAARVLAIDPLDWAGERMLVLGPSFTPQPAPSPPTVADQFDGSSLSDLWATEGGDWRVENGALPQLAATGEAAAICSHDAESFLAEVSVRSEGDPIGAYGVRVGDTHQFLLDPQAGRALGSVWSEESGWVASEIRLPADFNFGAFHLLRVERNAGQLEVTLDEVVALWQPGAPVSSGPLALVTHNAAAAFAGFALTQGWEDRFERDNTPEAIGWQGAGAWRIAAGLLACDAQGGEASLFKGEPLASYELVVNVRLDAGDPSESAGQAGSAGRYGIYPAASDEGPGPLLRVERQGEGWE
ncbi:MAG: family 43 glycosylhydrolase, partial [Chloroflexales bacterium]|nr:family 43 glycosylhydrolase [Chloroflexales bacterium]